MRIPDSVREKNNEIRNKQGNDGTTNLLPELVGNIPLFLQRHGESELPPVCPPG
jgi:hypothetical protein